MTTKTRAQQFAPYAALVAILTVVAVIGLASHGVTAPWTKVPTLTVLAVSLLVLNQAAKEQKRIAKGRLK